MALREEGRKQTYSNGDSDQVDLLYSPSRVQQWAPLEKLMRYESRGLERSQRKKELGVLERWWLEWKWDLTTYFFYKYTFSV